MRLLALKSRSRAVDGEGRNNKMKMKNWVKAGGSLGTPWTLSKLLAKRCHLIKAGGPWNFNSHLLVMHQLKDGDEPMVVPLFIVDFWVLIHDLPDGFMPEMVAKQLGNFIGVFIEYDVKVVSLGYKGIMRVRV
ncbi:hypothetical protein J1N35_001878 [Gossypium stocksii]|uniref:DUF4283 domain-containing protein n=1 Tax=Gossypium stocksii TaxID=47602 RepID=A0A9D4AK11_9ROSI|nr:hypothetical protein J1N35_001878 [Gossypium stocksii]